MSTYGFGAAVHRWGGFLSDSVLVPFADHMLVAVPDGLAPGLGSYVWNECDIITFPSGTHVAEVSIDVETGAVTLECYLAVDDYGRVINPMLTVGQVQGGVAQGIGQALLEHTVYDPQSGQLLSGSLLDYTLPRADDLPNLDIVLDGLPTAYPPGTSRRAPPAPAAKVPGPNADAHTLPALASAAAPTKREGT